jgi:hypothetical protein
VRIIGIDPGPEESAYVIWSGIGIITKNNLDNHGLLSVLQLAADPYLMEEREEKHIYCAIEQVRGFGLRCSNEIFDTCEWSGRFLQAFGEERTIMIPRKEAHEHICPNSGMTHDKYIREALIKRFGPGELKAIGVKKHPGPLYGITGHLWSALAVALTGWDRVQERAKVA